jgi:hypothetical protein
MNAMTLLRNLRHELGTLGMVSLGMVATSILFLFFILKPLEARNRALAEQVTSGSQLARSEAEQAPASTPAAKVAAFHEFLKSGKQTTDWLERLHAAAQRAGVEMRSAEYRMQSTGTRIERYEIRLPLRARYAQIRAFVDAALADIPMLSLDDIKFKRERAADSAVEAELRLTLHLVNP